MAIGGNTGLLALTGTLQQKSALAAYNRQGQGVEPLPKTAAADTHGLGTAEKQSQDITTFSRAGVAALENTQAIGDETIIREDDLAAEDLDVSQKLILERTEDALRAQANQTSEQLLALYVS